MHMIWTCPCYEQADCPIIQRTQRLIRRAKREVEAVPCYWLRGITPSFWTARPAIGDQEIVDINDVDEIDTDNLMFFLDGSGGEFTKDSRIRRCGWAWAIPQEPYDPDHPYEGVGKYGTCEGKQTVPRAELFALVFALERGVTPLLSLIHI